MASRSATLTLMGDSIPLADFARAVNSWQELMAGLSVEIAGSSLAWVIDDLDTSSAEATVRADAEDPTVVEAVVRAYSIVGESLSRNQRPPYSLQVVRAAETLTKVINGHVEGIKFETEEADFIVRARVLGSQELSVPLQAYGAIEGRVESLSKRRGLRFTLYDLVTDRAIACYLTEGREDDARDVWGRRAIVEGWISRDPLTGRALTVRHVSAISVIAEDLVGSYRDARGVVPLKPGELLPEQAIRRGRDA